MDEHVRYIKRCFQLARNGLGSTYPNPLVGAVIVHKGKIIGEGWHRKAGEAHAEVVAVEAVEDKSLLLDSTLYVNLEPCSHHGRTPACSTMIVRHGIRRVVIANTDPYPQVAGRGIKALERAGVEVITGIEAREGNELNRFFFTFHRKKRPYIILKWAQTADGYMAPADGKRMDISHLYARLQVHRLRSEVQAILVGRGTLEADNPRLDARYWNGRHPVPVVLGGKNISFSYRIFKQNEPVVVFGKTKETPPPHVELFPTAKPSDVLTKLYETDIQSVLVEGGADVLHRFIRAGLWDEAHIYTSPSILGNGLKAPLPPEGRWLKTDLAGDTKRDIFVHPQNQCIYDGRYL